MKRNTPNLRGSKELQADCRYGYGAILKEPSRINPIFLQKPYECVAKKNVRDSMGDLISRKAVRQNLFNEMIKSEVNSPVYLTLECVMQSLDDTETAYEIDKVVEQLENKIDPNVDIDTGEPCNNWVVDMQNKLIGECIDIVKAGGKHEIN